MAEIGKITVPINFEITEASKAVIKSLIAEVLLDDLKKGMENDVQAFVRAEIRVALADQARLLRQAGKASKMSEEEKIAALWEIVRVVATVDSTSFIEAYGNVCPFCKAMSQHGGVAHKTSCIVASARKLVAERPADGKDNLRTEA